MSNAVPPRLPILTPIDPFSVRPLPVRSAVPEPYRHWVTLVESMTQEIGLAIGTLPTVTPSHEGPSRLAPWEASLLGIPCRRSYAREVSLSVSGVPVMLARTLSTFGDPAVDVLRKLNQRPLAEVLFQDHRWCRITPPIPLLERASQHPGRASLWQYTSRNHSGNRGRILVQEYFLEALLRQSGQTLNRNSTTSPSWTS